MKMGDLNYSYSYYKINSKILYLLHYAKDYIDKINKDESNINATLPFDASNPLKQRLELLTKNALISFFLVLIL